MKPFYQEDAVTIFHGESLNIMRHLPSASVDALVTDPPYSSGGAYRGDRTQSTREKYVQTGVEAHRPDFSGDNRDQRSFLFWSTLWLTEARRVLRPGAPAVIFTDWRQLPITTDILQAGGFVWRGIVPWDKTEGVRPQKGRYRAQAEYAVWGNSLETDGQFPGQAAFAEQAGYATWGTNGPTTEDQNNGPVLPGVWRQSVAGASKWHIAGKPVGIMISAIGICPPGGTVLDPFGGGGSIAMACKATGRRCITIDEIAENCENMRTRLAQESLIPT